MAVRSGSARRGPRSARGFYARALNEAERADLPAALEQKGIDEEIALLRLRLRTALEQRPEDLPLMFRGFDLLTRMLVRRYGLSDGDAGGLMEQLEGLRSEVIGLVSEDRGVA